MVDCVRLADRLPFVAGLTPWPVVPGSARDASTRRLVAPRIVPGKLDAPGLSADLPSDPIHEFCSVANGAVRHACDRIGRVLTGEPRLHDRTDTGVRNVIGWHANLAQAARNCAADRLRSVVAEGTLRNVVRPPSFRSTLLDHNARSATVHADRASEERFGVPAVPLPACRRRHRGADQRRQAPPSAAGIPRRQHVRSIRGDTGSSRASGFIPGRLWSERRPR